jgi:quercetin dioxygenase-like cupin family protein
MHRSLHYPVAAVPWSDDEVLSEVRQSMRVCALQLVGCGNVENSGFCVGAKATLTDHEWLGSMILTCDKRSNLTGTTPNGRLGLNSFGQEHVSWSLTYEGGDVTHSRRELAGLFTAFAAAGSAHAATLPSRTYRFEDMPVRKGATAVSRAILQGQTRTGYGIEIHQTELPPGQAPHPPHRHLHEEMVMVREGTLEVTISGKAVTLGPGSVAYVASNEEHGWRNVGTSQASYFVLTLGRDL